MQVFGTSAVLYLIYMPVERYYYYYGEWPRLDGTY